MSSMYAFYCSQQTTLCSQAGTSGVTDITSTNNTAGWRPCYKKWTVAGIAAQLGPLVSVVTVGRTQVNSLNASIASVNTSVNSVNTSLRSLNTTVSSLVSQIASKKTEYASIGDGACRDGHSRVPWWGGRTLDTRDLSDYGDYNDADAYMRAVCDADAHCLGYQCARPRPARPRPATASRGPCD